MEQLDEDEMNNVLNGMEELEELDEDEMNNVLNGTELGNDDLDDLDDLEALDMLLNGEGEDELNTMLSESEFTEQECQFQP